MLNQIFTDAFAGLVEEIAAGYVARAEEAFAKLADTEDGRISKSRKKSLSIWNKDFRFVQHLLESNRAPANPDWSYGLNRKSLDYRANKFAEEQVAGFIAKLSAKLYGTTDVTVVRADTFAGRFQIRASLGGRHVYVEQDRVFKVSPKGKYFYQWPARIYVDGKFTPEEEFKSLAAAQA